MTKLGQDPAFPVYNSQYIGMVSANGINPTGMSKIFYAACASLDDIHEYDIKLIEAIMEEPAPNINSHKLEYMKWMAKASAKWRYMKAEELLKQEANDNL